ncbi:MAG: hypothetical protein E7660_00735 [Ruminococcaceae bacterium]|nr:hypothetical protein [Oscillospiraceae bacterium]
MKRLLALLLAAFMLVSFVSCGNKPEDPETDEPGGADTNEAPADALVTPLWTLSYDESVWVYDEEYFTEDEDDCSITLQILDPEDSEYYLINAEISAYIDEPYDFREDLVYCGFDQYEYAVNNSYELVKIGGVDCLKYESESWGEATVKYFARVEGAGATVEVEISAEDTADSRIEALLAGLTFTLEDTGNEDGPWEWEGEAFAADVNSVSVGSFTLETEWIEFDKYISTFETFNHSVAAVGDKVYVLSEGVLKEFDLDGRELTYARDIELPEDDYEIVQQTSDGALWLCGSMNDITVLKGGEVFATYEDIDKLAIAPSGTWGVDYFVGADCSIVTFAGGSCTEKAVTFSEVSTIMNLFVDEDTIYVCGSAADDSGHKVYVYDKDGALLKTLSGEDGEGLGSITFITKSENGYIGFDGNMRNVVLWDTDGKYVGEADGEDLFETYYPWFCSSTVLSDGSILTIMTEEREDKSATELIAFIVKGF